MRSTLRSARAIRAVLAAAASMTLVAGLFVHPVGAAAKKTKLSITKVSVGRSISVSGKLTAGTDSIGAVQVAKDEGGDDFPPAVPNGTDFTGAWIKADPVKRIVTFSFHLADPNPVFTISPGWVDLWKFTIDGNDTGQHLQVGNIGGFPVNPGPYALYCTIDGVEFECDHELTPVFADDGTVEVPISFDLLGAEPGSVIGTSAEGAGIETLTSTLGTGGIFFQGTDIVGETMAAADYTVPGKVTLGIAKAGTRLSKVRATIDAKVRGSGFSGSIPRPKTPGSYVVAAKTCYGAKVCTITGRTITI